MLVITLAIMPDFVAGCFGHTAPTRRGRITFMNMQDSFHFHYLDDFQEENHYLAIPQDTNV